MCNTYSVQKATQPKSELDTTHCTLSPYAALYIPHCKLYTRHCAVHTSLDTTNRYYTHTAHCTSHTANPTKYIVLRRGALAGGNNSWVGLCAQFSEQHPLSLTYGPLKSDSKKCVRNLDSRITSIHGIAGIGFSEW